MIESSLVNSGLAVPVFSPGDDPIACLNRAMAFLIAVASSRFPSTNNATQNVLELQETIHSSRWQRQRCNNYMGRQGEGHIANNALILMTKECSIEYRENLRVPDSQAIQTVILNNAAFQNEDLDTYDSNCDDISNAQAVLMANISNYGSDVILEVPHSETYLNDMVNQGVQAMLDFKQPLVVDFTDNEIHSDNNIISYSQYLQETQHANVQDTQLQA
ncbi:hypothetical protein Tco_0098224 [Tanacetum coccineum]